MSNPAPDLSRLSLHGMSSTAGANPQAVPPGGAGSGHAGIEESSSDLKTDSDYSQDDEDPPTVVRSPARLTYQLEHLPENKRYYFKDVFDDPPKLAVQRCRRIDNTYAFQMTELVTRSVRIRAPSRESPRQLDCSCGQGEEPCKHLLWLLDRISKQTIYEHDRRMPLKMSEKGYAEEMGDPFKSIADHHLNILADGLHCQIVGPDRESEDQVERYRAIQAHEMLAAVHKARPEDFRPDLLVSQTRGKRPLKRKDLDATIHRMLLDEQHFFDYFRSQCRLSDPALDRFRRLSQRVDHVLLDLDATIDNQEATEKVDESQKENRKRESPREVAWAARHILGVVHQIRSAIYSRDQPLQAQEALSAARTLVHVLHSVVSRNRDYPVSPAPLSSSALRERTDSDINKSRSQPSRTERNLYHRLIGDRDNGLVISELDLIPSAASHFIQSLEDALEALGVHGAPASYIDKYKQLVHRLRTPSIAEGRRGSSGLKRYGDESDEDRANKRMK